MPDLAEAFAGRIHAIAPDLVVHTAVFNGEELVNPATLGGFATSERGRAISSKPNDPLLLGDGMHQPHRMALDEPSQFAFEGGEVAGLDFDELSAACREVSRSVPMV